MPRNGQPITCHRSGLERALKEGPYGATLLPNPHPPNTPFGICLCSRVVIPGITCSMPQAEKLVSKFEELGSVTGDLGLSAIALAKFEDADGAQAGAYTDSAMASRTISADSKRVGMVSTLL